MPTIVHTLVSPMSTCQRAPEPPKGSLVEPRRVEFVEPAELGRRLFFPTFRVVVPALEVDRFFLTLPPSLDPGINSAEEGDSGALSSPK